jgi:hypothetical protein
LDAPDGETVHLQHDRDISMKIDGFDSIGPMVAKRKNADAASVAQYSNWNCRRPDSMLRRAVKTRINLARVAKDRRVDEFSATVPVRT